MTCVDCLKRREALRAAIMRGKLAEAAGHAIKGVIEIVKGADSGLDRSEPIGLGEADEGEKPSRVSRKRAGTGKGNDYDDTKWR